MPRSSLLNIPYEGTRQVAIGEIPTVWQKIHVDEDMFGAGKGRALAQLGHAIGSIGETIGAIDQKNQLEQADTMVKQADTQAMKEMTQLQEDYRNKGPEEAANGFDDYDKQARAIADRATASVAGNKHAKKIMGNHAEHYYQNAWKYGFKLKTEGVRNHANAVGELRVNQAVDSASKASDENQLTEPDTGVFSIINGEMTSRGLRDGWGKEITAAAIAEKKSLALNKFITNIATVGDPTVAQMYRDKWDDHLSPTDKKSLDKTIQTRINSNSMQDAARGSANGEPSVDNLPNRYSTPPPATVIEPPKGPKDPGYYRQKKSEADSEGGTIQLASGGTIEFSAQRKLSPYNKEGVPIPGYHQEADSATVENYIVQQAKLRGIDPGTALQVYKSEGSSQWRSTVPGENSWGPYQLFTGPSLDSDSGLGNKFYKDMKLDPRDPKTWRENIEWSLNQVVEKGWGPWNGAKAKGITGKQGVGEGARVIPVGASNMYQQSQVPEDYGEESSTVVGSEPAKNYGKTYATEIGERDAMSKPGSRITHSYHSYGKIRTLPPNPDLETALDKAAKDAGVRFNITSGGQSHNHDPAKKNTPGGWTGSLRHDGGNAVDGDITDESGKVLSRNDPRRLAFLEAAAKYGAGGTGAGYMDDPLKVHIGITGASGKVGKGLGPYAGNDAERQAVYRGLQGGGHDASTQFAQHGGSPNDAPGSRVKLASAQSGETMSDAPQPGFSVGERYAQATQTGYQPPPAATRKPVTADTPAEELNAMIKADRAKIIAKGWGEDAADSYEKTLRQEHARKQVEKADGNKRAMEVVGNEIFGDPARNIPGAENYDNMKRDPDLMKAWDTLTNQQKDAMDKAHRHINATNFKREPSFEDIARFKQLVDWSVANPNEFKMINPYDPTLNMPKKLADQLLTMQKGLMTKGIMGDPYRAQTYKALELPGVQEQLKLAGMTVPKDLSKADPRLKAFLPFLLADIRLYMEREKKVPDAEEVDGMVNKLLRESSKQRTFMGFGLTVPFTGSDKQQPWMTTVREFEVPLSKSESDAMYIEYQKWHPERTDVKSAADIPAEQQAYWKLHRRDVNEELRGER